MFPFFKQLPLITQVLIVQLTFLVPNLSAPSSNSNMVLEKLYGEIG